MSENRHYPYELNIQPGPKADTYQWALRKHGKLIQRSDRTFRSEEDAKKDGEKVIERELSDGTRRER